MVMYIEALWRTAGISGQWKLTDLFSLQMALEPLDQFLSLPSTQTLLVTERIKVIISRLREFMTETPRSAAGSSGATAGVTAGAALVGSGVYVPSIGVYILLDYASIPS